MLKGNGRFQQFLIFSSCLVAITIPVKENLNSITIILFFLFFVANGVFFLKQFKITIDKKAILFSLPFFCLLPQYFYSDPEIFFQNLIRSIPFFLFPFIFSNSRQVFNEKTVNSIFIWQAITGVIVSSLLLIIAFYRQITFSPDFTNVNWYFFAYRDFTEPLALHSTYIGMYLCLAFSTLLNKRVFMGNTKILIILSLLVLAVTIMLLGSRISLVCFIFILFYSFFVNFKKISLTGKFLFIASIILVPITIFLTVPIVKERMIDMTIGKTREMSYAKYGNPNNKSGTIMPRVEYWKCALEISKSNWLVGNGLGVTQRRMNECFIKKGFDDYAKLNYQTHNQYLNNFARGGLISLFVLLFVLFYPLLHSFQSKNVVYTLFICIIIISCLTENILNRHFGIVFFSFFNSVFYFSKQE